MPAILLDDLHFSYPPIVQGGQPAAVLQGVTLAVPAGQAVAIMGPTSSGKTTLALILAGLAPEMTGGQLAGRAWVDGLDAIRTPAAVLSRRLGLVFQEPERQLFNMTVADEVAFGLEGLALPPAEIAARVGWALAAVGLSDPHLLERAPWQLSGGQQKRLAIASIVALRPPILLLDEPMAGLDPAGRREVAGVLRELKQTANTTVLVMEKDAEFAARWAERVVVLAEGRVALDGTPAEVFRQVDLLARLGVAAPQVAELAARLCTGGTEVAFLTAQQAAGALIPILKTPEQVQESAPDWTPELVQEFAPDRAPEEARGFVQGGDRVSEAHLPRLAEPRPTAVQLSQVSFAYSAGARALDGVSLAVPQGQFVALVGQNGGGKSTLARHLNGLLRPQAGSVTIHGRPTAGRAVGDLAREVGYLFQNPDHQIFAPTVREEIAFGPRNLGLKGEPLDQRVRQALTAFDLERIADTPPAVLGYGQRRLVTVASLWAMQPPLWVLDEPTTGLDARIISQLLARLRQLHRAGHTILFITHDLRLAAESAERVIVVDRGQIALDGSPAAVLADSASLARFGLRPPPITRLSAALAPHGFPHPTLTVDGFAEQWRQIMS